MQNINVLIVSSVFQMELIHNNDLLFNTMAGTTSMTHHISKYHVVEKASVLQKKKRSAESSESGTRGSKASKVQNALLRFPAGAKAKSRAVE